MAAEAVLVKHQLLILNRPRKGSLTCERRSSSCAKTWPTRSASRSSNRRHQNPFPWPSREATARSPLLGSEAQLRQAFAKWIRWRNPLAFLVLVFSGWINRQQQDVIDYLLEENRVLRAAHGSHRIFSATTSPPSRRERQGPRSTTARRRRWPRDARHDPTLVPTPHRQQVRRLDEATVGRPKDEARYRVARRSNGAENPTWGYTRISGGLQHLGHDIGRNTIKAPRDGQMAAQRDPWADDETQVDKAGVKDPLDNSRVNE